MICRLWRGWTSPENADAYQRIVLEEVIPAIEVREMSGFRQIDVLRAERSGEVEFTTLMWFDDLESIRAFTGEDSEVAHVPARARAALDRFDIRVTHFEVLDRRPQQDGRPG